MKGKVWLGWGFLLAAVLGIWMCRETIMLHAAPQAALVRATDSLADELQTRLEDSPLQKVWNRWTRDEDRSYLVKITKQSPLLGEVAYDLAISTQSSPKRILADGNVTTGGKTLDISCYLDRQFAAVSSRQLLDGRYYGITYDSFRQTLNSHKALGFLLEESTLDQLVELVKELQIQMEAEPTELPDIQWADIRSGIHGLLALKLRVIPDKVYMDDEIQRVHRLEARYAGDEVAEAAQPYLSQLPETLRDILRRMQQDPNSYVQASFCLYDSRLIGASARLVVGQEAFLMDIQAGDSEDDDIHISLSAFTREGKKGIELFIPEQEDREAKSIVLAFEMDEDRPGQIWCCSWMPGSEQVSISVTEQGETKRLSARIRETTDGLQLSTGDAGVLMNLLSGARKEDYGQGIFTICPGRQILTPEYLDFSQWSMEDILVLLSNLGGLLGLPIE